MGTQVNGSGRLERRPASPVSKPVPIEDTYAEALDLEEGPADVRARRIPSSWIDGVARLEHHRPLTDIPPHRWRQFLSDCNKFLTGGENWAGRAAELGWNAATLFGCHRARPLAHPGGAGLLWAIQGGRLPTIGGLASISARLSPSMPEASRVLRPSAGHSSVRRGEHLWR